MTDPYLGTRTLMRRVLDTLLPDGPIWTPVPGALASSGGMDDLLDGIGDGWQLVYDWLCTLAYVRDPWQTPFLATLEREFGITPNTQLTDSQRRATLALRKFTRNRTSTINTMQSALNAAGLGVGGYGLQVFANDPAVDPGLFTTNAFQTCYGGPNAFYGYTVAGLTLSPWTAIATNGTTWVAVGTNVAATSTDGTNWTPQSIGTGNWSGVAWNGSVFCAVSTDGLCKTSPDGVTWTSRTIPSGAYTAVTWSAFLSLFVAVANGGTNRCSTSPTGTVWTAQSIPVESWNAITSADSLGLLIAVSDNRTSGTGIAVSSNATAWSSRTAPAARNWKSATWSSSRGALFGVSAAPSTGYAGMSSLDGGVTWNTVYIVGVWNTALWIPTLSLFVCIGPGPVSYSAYSSDLSSWSYDTTVSGGVPPSSYSAMAASGSTLLAVSQSSPSVAKSTDGMSWVATSLLGAFYGMSSGGGVWIVNGDVFQVSPNLQGYGYGTMYYGYSPAPGGSAQTAVYGYYTSINYGKVQIQSPATGWDCVFFIAGGATKDGSGYILSLSNVPIPQNLWRTLIEMILTLKPLSTWCVLMATQS